MLALDGRRIGGPHLGLHKRVSVFESLRHCLIFALRLLAARRLHRFLRHFLCVVGSWMDGRTTPYPTVIKLARRKRKCHPRYSAGRSARLQTSVTCTCMYVSTVVMPFSPNGIIAYNVLIYASLMIFRRWYYVVESSMWANFNFD